MITKSFNPTIPDVCRPPNSKLIQEQTIQTLTSSKVAQSTIRSILGVFGTNIPRLPAEDIPLAIEASPEVPRVIEAQKTESAATGFFGTIGRLLGGVVENTKYGMTKVIADVATAGFNYEKEVRHNKAILANKMVDKNNHLARLIQIVSPGIADKILGCLESGVVFDYLMANKEFFNQAVEVTLLRLAVNMVNAIYSQCNDEEKHEFTVFFLNAIISRFDSYKEIANQIKDVEDPIKRQERWQKEVAKPFIEQLVQDYLPEKAAILPIAGPLAPVINMMVLQGWVNQGANYIADSLEIFYNKGDDKHLEQDLATIKSVPDGDKLIGYIEIAVKELMNKTPYLGSAFGTSKVTAMLEGLFKVQKIQDISITSAQKEIKAHKKELTELKEWVQINVDAAFLKKGNTSAAWEILESHLNRILTKFAAETLRRAHPKLADSLGIKNEIDPASSQNVNRLHELLPTNALDGVSLPLLFNEEVSPAFDQAVDMLYEILSNFFKEHAQELVDFENSLIGKSDVQQQENIQKKYGQLLKELAQILLHGSDGQPLSKLEAELIKLGPIKDIVPSYLRAMFLLLNDPISKSERVTEKILETIGFEAVQENKKFINNLVEITAKSVCNLLREALPGQHAKVLEQLKLCLGSEISPEASQKILDLLNWTANDRVGGAHKGWEKIEEIVRLAILNTTLNELNRVRVESRPVNLSDVLITCLKSLHEIAPKLENDRLSAHALHNAKVESLQKQLAIIVDKQSEMYELIQKELQAEDIRYSKAIKEIYKPLTDKLFFSLTKGNHSLLTILPSVFRQDLGTHLEDYIANDIPQLLSDFHQQFMPLQDKRSELRKDVICLYKNDAPVLLARIGSEFVAKYALFYIQNESRKQVSSDEEITDQLLPEKIIEQIVDILEKKEGIWGKDISLGKQVADYIRANQKQFTAELATALLKVTDDKNGLEEIAKVVSNYTEGLFLKVFIGLHNTITANEDKDPEILMMTLGKMLPKIRDKLAQVNGSSIQFPEAAISKEGLLNRIVSKLGFNKKDIPVPNELKDTVWETLEDTVLPKALEALAENFVNSRTLKKVILSALESLDEQQVTEDKEQKEVRQAYEQAKRKAMKEGRPIPRVPVVPTQVKPHRELDTFAEQIGLLIKEIAKASNAPELQFLLKKKLVLDKVSILLADMAYDQLVKSPDGSQAIKHLNTAFTAALSNLNLAKQTETGLKMIDVQIQQAEENGSVKNKLIDSETKEAISADDLKENHLFKISETTPEELKSEEDEIDQAIDEMLARVGANTIIHPVKKFFKDIWFAFQDAFDRACSHLPLVGHVAGEIKVWLDELCRAAFEYIFGKMCRSISRRIIQDIRSRFQKKSRHVVNALAKAFDRSLAKHMSKIVLETWSDSVVQAQPT